MDGQHQLGEPRGAGNYRRDISQEEDNITHIGLEEGDDDRDVAPESSFTENDSSPRSTGNSERENAPERSRPSESQKTENEGDFYSSQRTQNESSFRKDSFGNIYPRLSLALEHILVESTIA